MNPIDLFCLGCIAGSLATWFYIRWFYRRELSDQKDSAEWTAAFWRDKASYWQDWYQKALERRSP